MTFSPFARFRNFTLTNLKSLLELYPDSFDSLTWDEVGNMQVYHGSNVIVNQPKTITDGFYKDFGH